MTLKFPCFLYCQQVAAHYIFMTPGKVFDRFVVVVVVVLHNNQHHLVFFFFFFIIIIIFFFFFLCCFFLLLVICLTSMSFGFFDIAEIWKAQRDSRHLLLLLLLLCWALSCYIQSVVLEIVFLMLPSKCCCCGEFFSLLWVTFKVCCCCGE